MNATAIGTRWVYDFQEGGREMRDLLGGKGAGVAEMIRIVPLYTDLGIVDRSPFGTLDTDGVGELIAIALARGRAARPGLEAGICGEHGGDPDSIRFCHGAGLDYVSCSPFRVPIARVAAAQAVLGDAHQRGSAL